jgi:16S rRNA (adenine1518-N6/adenine1519-N6)-dimethyltransferase
MRKQGQHFLTNQHILTRIVEQAELSREDTVLEIGAGSGNLTQLLCEQAGKVIAIEKDPNLVAYLKNTLEADNLQIIHADALKINFPPFNKIVSNLPYQISSPITFKLFKYNFDLAILMYQHEFAKRMTAKPNTKNYSRLTVATQYFADAQLLFKVPKSAFQPPPQVDSAVIKLKMKKTPPTVTDEKFFLQVVKAAFLQRRKKLRNTLSANLNIDKNTLKQLPSTLLDKRAENLSLQEFVELSNKLHTLTT